MKTILITGSTDGVGKETAKLLLKKGHEVIIHGRNLEKVKATREELNQLNPSLFLKGFTYDLSDLSAVQNMANDINENCPKLDVLINNAGVFKVGQPRLANGQDLRFVVNHLAPVILTNGLSSLLSKCESPTVINLSSAAQAPVSISALKGETPLSDNEAYAQSKLALTMWSVYEAKQKPNWTIIPVNPGSLLNTNMVKQAYGHHWSPVSKGAEIVVDLATNPEFKEYSGEYYDNDSGRFASPHPYATDFKKIEELVSATNKLIGS